MFYICIVVFIVSLLKVALEEHKEDKKVVDNSKKNKGDKNVIRK